MNKRFFVLLFVLGISIGGITQAQDTYVKGTVLRQDSLSAIYGAVIFNKNGMLGTLSNRLGNFRMRVRPGDTLQISHIGFVTHLLIFNQKEIEPDLNINVVMQLRSYELPDIDIRRFRIRDRIRQPTTMKRTDNITYDGGTIRFDFNGSYYTNPWSSAGANALPMPTFGVAIPDFKQLKRQEQLEKVAVEEAKDRKKRKVSRKYNREIVNQLTGLKGNELENYMNFCKPTDEAVTKFNDYELTYYILDCYKKFREENE